MTIEQIVKNIIVNCQPIGASVDINCGKKAERKMTVLGLLAETKKASLHILI